MRLQRPAMSSLPARRERRATSGRRRLAAEQDSILELQRLAGNRAVREALARRRAGGRVTSVDAVKLDLHPEPPEDGLRSIRARKGGAGIMGLTIRAIEDNPPLLKPEPPVRSGDAGWTVKPRQVGYLPEPILEEFWPTQGPHKIADNAYIKIDHTWETKLKDGEDEHARDATLAWQLTWKKVADLINELAKKPGPPEATPEAATKALWRRYREALPPDLRPEGERPTESAQRDVLDVRGGTFFGWMWEITVVRDTRNYHEPKTKPVDVAGDATVSVLDTGQSQIPGPKSEDLIEEVRKKYTKGRRIQGSKLP